ncbi:MAG: tyrosine-protein phosphatase [Deltaproteobacteria bacterium]|nr:tyrosine-protein phosphatase [Deltaproteobacteria bacterium]
MTQSRAPMVTALVVYALLTPACEPASTPTGAPASAACARPDTTQPALTAPPGATQTSTGTTATTTETKSSPTAASAAPSAATPRPTHWALPLDKPGLPNLHKVSDELYRGAQPTAAGMGELATLKVRTVVNLRLLHSDRKLLRGFSLDYEHVRMEAWEAEDDEVIEVLKLLIDPAKQPVFLHCKHGADRTGLVVAVYRIVVQGWSKEDAIAEMTEGGFGHHSVWHNLVEYLEQLDVARIKRKAGLK